MAPKERSGTARPKAGRPRSSREPEKDKKRSPKAERERFDVEIYRAWCKGCGICVAFCPREVLSMNERGEPQVSGPERCTGCTWCELRCPDFAISVSRRENRDSGACVVAEKPRSRRMKKAGTG
jgi:2-oxoglutarate ferredoxin oxidoreductase subunit delta